MVVMTLVVGDDADVLEAHLRFHLNAGVDTVVVGGGGSSGEARSILERFARDGGVRRVAAGTRAQVASAARELGADWVIESDADEFWWPRGGSLAELLGEIPPGYDAVQALVRPFPPVAEGEGAFSERLLHRLSLQTAIEDPRSLWRPPRKLVRRARGVGGERVLRGWYPIEVLWFPARSPEQLTRRAGEWARQGYASLALDEAQLGRGLETGALQRDTRLRDALRSLQAGEALEFPRANVVESALLGAEAAALGEGELLLAQRRLEELEQRVAAVERASAVAPGRLLTKAASVVRGGSRR